MAFSARASGSSGSPQSRMLALTECISRFINFMSEQIEQPNLAIGMQRTTRQSNIKFVEFGIYQRPGEKIQPVQLIRDCTSDETELLRAAAELGHYFFYSRAARRIRSGYLKFSPAQLRPIYALFLSQSSSRLILETPPDRKHNYFNQVPTIFPLCGCTGITFLLLREKIHVSMSLL